MEKTNTDKKLPGRLQTVTLIAGFSKLLTKQDLADILA